MTRRQLSVYLAGGQLLLVLLASGAGLVFRLLDSGLSSGVLSVLPLLVIGISASAVAALMMARRPENVIGRIFATIGVSASLAILAGSYVAYRHAGSGDDISTTAMAWLAGVSEPVAFHLIAPFLLLFPDGRLPSRKWRWVAVLTSCAVIASLLITTITPWPLLGYQASAAVPAGLENPLALPGGAGTTMAQAQDAAFLFVVLFSLPASVLSMVFRYRAAGIQQRQQIKWIAFAGGLVVAAVMAGNVLDTSGIRRWDDENSLPVLLTTMVMTAIPVAAGIAILRYRLYDIDRIINRTLVYAVLTAGLGAVYLGLVVGLQALLRPASGGSDFAIVATTLVVAALFHPARHRVQTIVDRRFNRRSYDAARTVEAFSARLRDEIDLDTLRYELLSVIDETMQPAWASLWLRRRP